MNGNDLIEFEESRQDLQDKFLEKKGFDISKYTEAMKDILESQEYWDFVQEEYDNYQATMIDILKED